MRQLKRGIASAKMVRMMRRFAFLLAWSLWLVISTSAQGAQADLLGRVNRLRQSQGLHTYTLHAALNAAAANHAGWLARTGIRSHYQEDGAGPKARAANAGYSSNWVSENYYFGLGAGPDQAWRFWLNSPGHYAGLVSPYYDNIGIASASAAGRNAFVLVFGNSTGRLIDPSPATGSSGEAPAPAAVSYVVGLDENGNIMHEVQSGDTLGEIALIYGYTWDDIAYMLEINGMTAEDIRVLQPGSIFLVPPKDGTFTPSPTTPEPATMDATATPDARMSATPAATETPAAPSPTVRIRIGAAQPSPSDPTSLSTTGEESPVAQLALLALLAVAAIAQAGIIFGAAVLLLRKSF